MNQFISIESQYLLRLVNVGLRGLTLSCKFILIFSLAYYLEPNEVGLYGLFVASVGYGIFPLGIEFYTFSTRELLRTEKVYWSHYLSSQALLYVILYVIFLPLFSILFFLGFLPWYCLIYFYIILILEHVNQEMMRLLIALSEQLSASIALFMRQGIWIIFFIPLMHYYPGTRSVENLLIFWASGSFTALLFSTFVFYRMQLQNWALVFDRKWVKKGARIALPFFVSTLCLNSVSTFDKYLFDFIVSREVLGAYVFFLGLSAALISFLDAAVFSFIYPRMIMAYSKGLIDEFNSHIKKMFVQVVCLSVAFFLLAIMFLDFILVTLGKPIYSENIKIFYVLVLAMFIQALSNIPHYALYARNFDSPIIKSHVASLLFFFMCFFILKNFSTVYSIPAALCMTHGMILIWKVYSYSKVKL